jgi:hypothetical protein
MIEKGLILTGCDTELLSQALEEVKAKVYAESRASLDDTQSLATLVSCFRDATTSSQEKELFRMYIDPPDKRPVLGTIIGRHSGAKHI